MGQLYHHNSLSWVYVWSSSQETEWSSGLETSTDWVGRLEADPSETSTSGPTSQRGKKVEVLDLAYWIAVDLCICSGHQAGRHQDKASTAPHRVQVLPDHAGRGWYTRHQVVRLGRYELHCHFLQSFLFTRRLQRDGDGALGSQSGRSL